MDEKLRKLIDPFDEENWDEKDVLFVSFFYEKENKVLERIDTEITLFHDDEEIFKNSRLKAQTQRRILEKIKNNQKLDLCEIQDFAISLFDNDNEIHRKYNRGEQHINIVVLKLGELLPHYSHIFTKNKLMEFETEKFLNQICKDTEVYFVLDKIPENSYLQYLYNKYFNFEKEEYD
jgi:hypothetical protein